MANGDAVSPASSSPERSLRSNGIEPEQFVDAQLDGVERFRAHDVSTPCSPDQRVSDVGAPQDFEGALRRIDFECESRLEN